MKSITSRFVMLIATAAIAPLVIYGVVSVQAAAKSGTEESVAKGNLRHRDAGGRADQPVHREQPARPAIHRPGTSYVGLEPWQQSRILKDTVLDFPEFRELSMFDAGGKAARHEPLRPADGHRFPIHRRPTVATSTSRRSSRTTMRLPTTTIAVRMVPRRPGTRLGRRRARARRAVADGRSASRSARPAAQRSSPRAADSSPTATPTRSASSRQQRVTAGSNRQLRPHCGAKSVRPRRIYNDDETGE